MMMMNGGGVPYRTYNTLLSRGLRASNTTHIARFLTLPKRSFHKISRR